MITDDASRVRLEPDLGIRDGQNWRWVGDVKYKKDTRAGHNPDLYQLLAYATATNLETATLIYADGPRTDTIHHISNTKVTLRSCHLNLDQSPSSVLHDLRRIANSNS